MNAGKLKKGLAALHVSKVNKETIQGLVFQVASDAMAIARWVVLVNDHNSVCLSVTAVNGDLQRPENVM